MEFQPGTITLNAISGGVLGSGVIPFPRFERDYQEAENAGNVTVTGGTTELNVITLTGAVAGDRIIVIARCEFRKGGVAGLTQNAVDRTVGPGVVNFMLRGAFWWNELRDTMANGRWADTLTLFGDVTTGGNITLRQYGVSGGSDSTVTTGMAAIAAWVIPGS